MKCWHCNSDVIWGGDHSYEDYGLEGEGIVSNLSCSNKECDTEVLTYYTIKKEDDIDNKIHDHPLGVGFAQKDFKSSKKDDTTIHYRDVGDENDSL